MRRDRRRVPRRGRPRRRVVAQLEQLVLSDGTTIERPRAHVLEAQLAGSAQINPARVESPPIEGGGYLPAAAVGTTLAARVRGRQDEEVSAARFVAAHLLRRHWRATL